MPADNGIRRRMMERCFVLAANAAPIRALSKRYMGKAVVLTYHMVVDKKTYLGALNPLRLSMVSCERFEEQISYISKAYKVIRIEELKEALSGAGSGYAVITFDDGYASTMEKALPVLKRHNAPAAFYITTSVPDEKRVWWLDACEMIKREKAFTIELKAGRFSWPLESVREKEACLREIITLGSVSKADRDLLSGSIRQPCGSGKEEAPGWDELRRLSEDPLVTFGAHTHNHLSLAALPQEEALFEVAHSKKRLEEELGIGVAHFAYPFGGSNDAVQREFEIAKGCGFETAVTTRRAGVRAAQLESLHSIPRYPVMERDTAAMLKARLNGLESLLKHRGRKIVY